MGFITNAIDFLIAMALILFAWLVYLWINNRLSRIEMPALKEILGALLSIGLFAALAVILYFFSLPLAMGAIAVMLLMTLAYIVNKGRRSLLTKRES